MGIVAISTQTYFQVWWLSANSFPQKKKNNWVTISSRGFSCCLTHTGNDELKDKEHNQEKVYLFLIEHSNTEKWKLKILHMILTMLFAIMIQGADFCWSPTMFDDDNI